MKTLIGSVAITATAALFYLMQTTPIYTARAQILIDSKASQLTREGSSDIAYPLDSAQVESQIAILRSSMLTRSVLENLNLLDEVEFKAISPGADREQRILDLTEHLLSSLDVRRVDLSYAININFSAQSPQIASKLANGLSEAYLRDQVEIRAQAARAASEWLEQRVAELRRQMNAAARRVQEFKVNQDYRIVKSGEWATAKAIVEAKTSVAEPTTLEELESTSTTYRKIYENFYQAYTEAIQRESYPGSQSRIISRAQPPVSKSHPRSVMILALAVLAGVMAGSCLAFFRHAMRF